MPTPLTEVEILRSISPFFEEDFQRLKESHLQPREEIYCACNCSINTPYESGDQRYNTFTWGYFLLTNHRRLMVSYYASPTTGEIVYFKGYVEGGFFEKFTGLKSDWRRWAFPPYVTADEMKDEKLLNAFWKQRLVIERQLMTVSAVKQGRVSVKSNGQQINLVEFDFWDDSNRKRHVAFEPGPGKLVYDLTLHAIHNGGRIAQEKPDNNGDQASDEIVKLLEALVKLQTQGILTNEEFENKKRELLKRL